MAAGSVLSDRRLSVSKQDNSKSYGWILMKFVEQAEYELEKS